MDVTKEELLQGLNSQQAKAVVSLTGSNLVIAGAGSGKTAVLTRRLAYLIANGVDPGKILCLTFTNKAAGEMNSRVRNLLNKVGINIPMLKPWQEDYEKSPLICTFHSLGVRFLREFGQKIGLGEQFNILDTSDQQTLIKKILKDQNIDSKQYNPRLFTYFISQCKQELLMSQESKKLTKEFLPIFHQVYKIYEESLRKNNNVDFDDLLLLTYIILKDFEEVRDVVQARWYHLMVDEFQDTNTAQTEIVKLIMPAEKIV